MLGFKNTEPSSDLNVVVPCVEVNEPEVIQLWNVEDDEDEEDEDDVTVITNDDHDIKTTVITKEMDKDQGEEGTGSVAVVSAEHVKVESDVSGSHETSSKNDVGVVQISEKLETGNGNKETETDTSTKKDDDDLKNGGNNTEKEQTTKEEDDDAKDSSELDDAGVKKRLVTVLVRWEFLMRFQFMCITQLR